MLSIIFPVFPNVYTVNTINLAADIFYDCNKTHDANIVSTDTTSLWKSHRFVTRVYLRERLHACIMRADISGVLTLNQIHYRPPTHRPCRVFVLIAKFPDAVRYGNHAPPQAFAPSVECRFASVHSLGEAIIPTCIEAYSLYHFDSRFGRIFPLRCNAIIRKEWF